MIESEKFMRLDKFLCENNIGTRSQVKDAIRKGMVTINGTVAKKPEEKIEETKTHRLSGAGTAVSKICLLYAE